jgi:hypothetical protein
LHDLLARAQGWGKAVELLLCQRDELGLGIKNNTDANSGELKMALEVAIASGLNERMG